MGKNIDTDISYWKIEKLTPGVWLVGVTDSPAGTGFVELNVALSQTIETVVFVNAESTFSIADFYTNLISN